MNRRERESERLRERKREEEKELPVTVALMMRPLVGPELVDGCQACVFPSATEPSVTLVSDHKFTYDHVYHPGTECDGPTEKRLFEQCVEPLVNGLLSGYNATVLAYGQTGSGKTHTMGTVYEPGGATEGLIPRVMNALFSNIAALSDDVTVNLKVSFIEIHKEDIRDLLGNNNQNVSIRDAPGATGGVVLVGVKELPVNTLEKMAGALASGSQSRATAATGMSHDNSAVINVLHLAILAHSLVGSQSASRWFVSEFDSLGREGPRHSPTTCASGVLKCG